MCAYTTGNGRDVEIGGRGLEHRPVTISPSIRRPSKVASWRCSRSASPRLSHMITESSPEPSASSAPAITGPLNRPKLSEVTSPTVKLRGPKIPRTSSLGR